MGSCYKCGKTLPGTQTECEEDCTPRAPDSSVLRWQDGWEINWDTVQTFEQLRELLQLVFAPWRFHPQIHGNFDALKKFLKPPPGERKG